MVTGVDTPFGDDVPPTETPGANSTSPGLCGTPPPRSMKSERSFISRAWMSSSLPWDSEDSSHLTEIEAGGEDWGGSGRLGSA